MNNKSKTVSIFKSCINSSSPIKSMTLEEILEVIKNEENPMVATARKLLGEGNKDGFDEVKKQISAFTIGGEFPEGRKLVNLIGYTGLIPLDIDKVDEKLLKQLKQRVCEIEYTYCCFKSVSGNGLRILVQVNTEADQHENTYNQVADYYEKELQIEIDRSGKDIARLCILSYDPELFLNENSKNFNVMTKLEEKKTEKRVQVKAMNNSAETFKYAVKLTERLIQYGDGNRNNFVHLLANNCNRKGIQYDEAVGLIKASYNHNDAEVTATIKSAYKNTAEHGKFAFENKLLKYKTRTNGAPQVNEPIGVPLDELIKRKQSEPTKEKIWAGIVENNYGIIFGLSKAGKTTFAENLAMTIASGGKEFLGLSINTEKRKILFISLEEHWEQRTERNQKQVEKMCAQLDDCKWFENYIVCNENAPKYVSSDEEWEVIETLIEAHNPDIVIIDSLGRLFSGAIEDSRIAKEISLKLRDLTEKYKITLMVIHHITKCQGQLLTIDSIAGSRFVVQEADFAIGVNKTPTGQRYIKELFYRYAKDDFETVRLFEIDEYQWISVTGEDSEASLMNLVQSQTDNRYSDANRDLLSNYIKENATVKDGTIKSKDLLKGMVQGGAMSRSTLYATIDKLKEEKLIESAGTGEFKLIGHICPDNSDPSDNPDSQTSGQSIDEPLME